MLYHEFSGSYQIKFKSPNSNNIKYKKQFKKISSQILFFKTNFGKQISNKA